MVQDLTETMFEAHGEPKLLKNEIGHAFLIDRGRIYVRKSWDILHVAIFLPGVAAV